MPTFGWLATRLVREADVVSVHLPQFDAAGVAARGRLFGKPTVLTYHCDLKLPRGWFNRVVNSVVRVMNHLSGAWADAVVAYTQDFAEASPFLQKFGSKVRVISPPVEIPEVGAGAVAAFARMHDLENAHPVIGMAARMASEKGVEVLLTAMPAILDRYPSAQVLFAGQFRNVLGEEAYADRLRPLLERHKDHWQFLGVLNPQQMAAFYPNVDVIVVPSLNSTESFGLVQVEAMLCGTPAIASDLPGVRQPVRQSGMGEVVPVGDSDALAEAIARVVDARANYLRHRDEIVRLWSTESTARDYESLFQELLGADGGYVG